MSNIIREIISFVIMISLIFIPLMTLANAELSQENQMPYKHFCLKEAQAQTTPRYPFDQDLTVDENNMQCLQEWWHARLERQGITISNLGKIQAFTKQCSRLILAQGDNTNTLFSPINTWLYLGLLTSIMKGDSLVQVLNFLNLASASDLMLENEAIYRSLYWDDGFSVCRPASSMWMNEQVCLSESLSSKLAIQCHTSVFQGPMGEYVYNESYRAWLNRQTNNLLKEYVEELGLNRDASISICTTLYMRSPWSLPFEKDKTYSDVFYSANEETIVDFMYKEEGGGTIYQGINFSAVIMDLQEGSCVTLILPESDAKIEEVIQSEELYEFLYSGKEWANRKTGRVRISVPRIDIFTSSPMEDILTRMGLANLFDSEKIEFSNEIVSDADLRLAATGQYSRFIMNEDGIEAASIIASDSASFRIPDEEEIDIILNRPFIFSVLSERKIPLFIGTFNSP